MLQMLKRQKSSILKETFISLKSDRKVESPEKECKFHEIPTTAS